MAQYKNAVLTDRGAALLNKAQAGQCRIKFTRIAIGDGDYTDIEKTFFEMKKRTALKRERQTFAPESISIVNKTSVLITANFTNHSDDFSLGQGYYINEVGLFAMEDGVPGTEVLYSIAVAEIADFLPPYNGHNPAMIVQKYYTTVNNSAQVTIEEAKTLILVDDADGAVYRLGVNNGQLYCKKLDE